jgi:hypothetical protein
VVGAIDADGWPTATLAASRVAGTVLSLQFADGDPFVDDLARDPSVCCVADEHESYYEIRGVIIHGRLTASGGTGSYTLEPARTISFDFGKLR